VLTTEQCYEKNPNTNLYYQGDVLSDFPFPSLPTYFPAGRKDAWGILRARPTRNRGVAEARPVGEALRNLPNELIGRAARDVPDAWADEQPEAVIASCQKTTIILVSRSCDIDKDSRKHLLIAPVIAIDSLSAVQKTPEKLDDLREGRIFHRFHLPEIPPKLLESFADLSQMVPLHKSFFDAGTLLTCLVARLTPVGTIALQNSLSDFHGQKFGFSPEDTCPETSRYSCSFCFHSGEATPDSRTIQAKDTFGECRVCGGE
jgi:hypothetical protein